MSEGIVAQEIMLSSELKSGTKDVHRAAENVHFVKEFAHGRIKEKWYKILLADLYFIYRCLEEECERNKDHQLFKSVHYPEELSRTKLIEDDLQYFVGDNWKNEIKMSEATKAYVARIKKISEEDPSLLIAHHYTRYLGDLSGGQILKRCAQKGMSLPDGYGVSFFTFDKVTDAKQFKRMYRGQLDALQVSQETIQNIVNESRKAFGFNMDVFKEIDSLMGCTEDKDMQNDNNSLENEKDHRRLNAPITYFHRNNVIFAAGVVLLGMTVAFVLGK